jgi:hypothetical protein
LKVDLAIPVNLLLISFALMQKKQKIKAEFIFTPFFAYKLGNKKTPSGLTVSVSDPI